MRKNSSTENNWSSRIPHMKISRKTRPTKSYTFLMPNPKKANYSLLSSPIWFRIPKAWPCSLNSYCKIMISSNSNWRKTSRPSTTNSMGSPYLWKGAPKPSNCRLWPPWATISGSIVICPSKPSLFRIISPSICPTSIRHSPLNIFPGKKTAMFNSGSWKLILATKTNCWWWSWKTTQTRTLSSPNTWN